MMFVPYAFTVATRSLIRERWINLLSILTIAAGLLIISIAIFSFYNIDAATKKLPEKFSMILYLDDNMQREKVDYIISALKKNAAVASLRFISKEEAMKELKAGLKNSSYVFEGLDDNPLQDSLELRLKKEDAGTETARKIAAAALKIKGVKDVDYGESFLSALQSLKSGVKTVGFIIVAILSTGIIFVCYSTVKILFYRRKEEVETFKLLGATRGFIRLPFLLEGAFIGAGGGLICLVGILSLYYIVLAKLSLTMPVFKSVLFPAALFLPLPVIGMLLGITGAAIAIGRLRY